MNSIEIQANWKTIENIFEFTTLRINLFNASALPTSASAGATQTLPP
jgi:hypothetical protein